MSSNYQLAMKLNSIFRFPVLPEEIEVSYGSDNSNLKVYGVGECTIIQDSAAANISFSSLFQRMQLQQHSGSEHSSSTGFGNEEHQEAGAAYSYRRHGNIHVCHH